MSVLATDTSGESRLKRSLRRLRRTPDHYQEPPGSASEAETRNECDRLARQVRLNRRLLLVLALSVIARHWWLGEADLLVDLIEALP